MFRTPVIFVFFNRPEVTRRTFARLREIRPARLHLVSDGPRPHRPEDAGQCGETRGLVERMLDWPCEVTRDYSPVNLGCGRRLSSGLTAAFDLLGEAIVVEDDVLPHPDFFPFCAEQLARHRDNPHIHSISGFNPLGLYAPAHGPVVPTVFNCIWGWASWRRAWKDYDFAMSAWADSEVREQVRRHVGSDLVFQHFAHNFDRMLGDRIDTWDFQWSFTMLSRKRLALASSVNLIDNIGFAPDATHTTVPEPYFRGLHARAAVPARRERDLARPDRCHDKLYAEVILTGSRRKIALARFIARHPLALGLFRQKIRHA